MTELEELSLTINELNDLWPLLEGEEKTRILDERDKLDELASTLAHKTINESEPALNEAIESLNEATGLANETRKSINNISETTAKVARLVGKVSKAAVKVTGLIAVL